MNDTLGGALRAAYPLEGAVRDAEWNVDVAASDVSGESAQGVLPKPGAGTVLLGLSVLVFAGLGFGFAVWSVVAWVWP